MSLNLVAHKLAPAAAGKTMELGEGLEGRQGRMLWLIVLVDTRPEMKMASIRMVFLNLSWRSRGL